MNTSTTDGSHQISKIALYFIIIMNFSNLTEISLATRETENRSLVNQGNLTVTADCTFKYTSNELRDINKNIKNRQLSFGIINKVRELKLNRKPICSKLTKYRQHARQSRVNNRNLVKIPIMHKDKIITDNVRIVTANVRSIKSKVNSILEQVELLGIDILAITETWLKDQDTSWVQTSSLVTEDYNFDFINRKNKQGGGIGLLHTRKLQITPAEDQGLATSTLEKGIWNTKIRDKNLTIVVVYHPPFSSSKANTSNLFLNEVREFTQFLVVDFSNIILLGDINVHIQDLENQDSILYNDQMAAMGFQQHINFATHKHSGCNPYSNHI